MRAAISNRAAAPDRVAALHAGLSPTPRNGDARELGSVAGVRNIWKKDEPNSGAPCAADQAISIAAKHVATLRAWLMLLQMSGGAAT